jgi:hypothetical protein
MILERRKKNRDTGVRMGLKEGNLGFGPERGSFFFRKAKSKREGGLEKA